MLYFVKRHEKINWFSIFYLSFISDVNTYIEFYHEEIFVLPKIMFYVPTILQVNKNNDPVNMIYLNNGIHEL